MNVQEFRNSLLAAASDAKQSGFLNTQKALLSLLAELEQEQRTRPVAPCYQKHSVPGCMHSLDSDCVNQ